MNNAPTLPQMAVEQLTEIIREAWGNPVSSHEITAAMDLLSAYEKGRLQALAEPATGGELREALEQAQYALTVACDRAADLGAQGLAKFLSDESDKAAGALSTTSSNPSALVERPLNTSGVVSHETGFCVTQTPPAPSDGVLRDQVARVIDPSAWQRHDEILLNLEYENASGKVLQQAAADRLVAPSLAKADAILALSNPAGEGGVRARALEAAREWICDRADKDEHPEGWDIIRSIDAALSADGGEAG